MYTNNTNVSTSYGDCIVSTKQEGDKWRGPMVGLSVQTQWVNDQHRENQFKPLQVQHPSPLYSTHSTASISFLYLSLPLITLITTSQHYQLLLCACAIGTYTQSAHMAVKLREREGNFGKKYSPPHNNSWNWLKYIVQGECIILLFIETQLDILTYTHN